MNGRRDSHLLLFLQVASFVSVATSVPDVHNILLSMDERLRHLEGSWLETFSRKLENLDGKLNRMETLLGIQMDKISENISAKNFKDDVAKTNLFKRIDVLYEGLLHRLAYFESKVDVTLAKVQVKTAATSKHLHLINQPKNLSAQTGSNPNETRQTRGNHDGQALRHRIGTLLRPFCCGRTQSDLSQLPKKREPLSKK